MTKDYDQMSEKEKLELFAEMLKEMFIYVKQKLEKEKTPDENSEDEFIL